MDSTQKWVIAEEEKFPSVGGMYCTVTSKDKMLSLREI